MNDDVYSPPTASEKITERNSKVRAASLVVSILFWLVCLFYWGAILFIRFRPEHFFAEQRKVANADYTLILGASIFIGIAVLLLFIRWNVWIRKKKESGWGYFLFIFPFYFFTLFGIVAPYIDFFTHGRKGILFNFGFLFTLLFLIASFPWLSWKKKVTEP